MTTSTRQRAYLLFAFTVSTAGDWLYRLALPLLVLQMTGSAVGTALAYALEYIPYIIFSMVGGVAADRADRKRLLIVADLTAALLVTGLVVVLGAGSSHVWPVFLVAFLISSVRPIYHPAFQSLLPSLVPAKELTKLNSRVQTIDSMFLIAGPLLGVGVVAALGVVTALWLNAVSFVISALALLLIRVPASEAGAPAAGGAARGRLWGDLVDTVRYLAADRITLNGSLVMTGSAAGLMIVEANLIYYLVTLRGFPLSTVGIVLGAYGVGSVIGALAAPALANRVAPGVLIAAALLAAGAVTALLATGPGIVGMAVLWACVGACVMAVVVVWFSLRQQIVPRHLLGRVVAVSRMLAYAATPLGALAGAWALSTIGGAPTIAISAAVQILVAGLAFGSVLRTARFPTAAAQPA